MIAGFQDRCANPLLFEPPWVGPLSAELAHHAAAVIGREVHPRVGIAIVEADDVSLERDHLVFVVIARERMVRVCRGCRYQGTQRQQNEFARHIHPPLCGLNRLHPPGNEIA